MAARHRVMLAVLRAIDLVLQWCIPARARRVAWISWPDHVGNAYHLYRHMLTTRRGYEHVWLVADPSVRARIERDAARFDPEGGNRVRVVARHRPGGYVQYLRSRTVFHTHGVYPWVGHAVRRRCVSLWHGMPIKAIGALNTVSPNPHPTFGTHHLATSEFYRGIIGAAFRAPPDRVVTTGLPRCDVLREPASPAVAGQARGALGVPDDHRLVVWLPTYRVDENAAPDHGAGIRTFLDDLPAGFLEQVDEHAGRVRATVVIKPHPSDALNTLPWEGDLDNVRLLRSGDWLGHGIELYDLLSVTDGLISDLSSALVDWLVTDRPLGMVGFDPATYPRDTLLDVAQVIASPRVHDLADPAALADFFRLVREDRDGAVQDPELSAWLYRRDLVHGCETVLRAIGL